AQARHLSGEPERAFEHLLPGGELRGQVAAAGMDVQAGDAELVRGSEPERLGELALMDAELRRTPSGIADEAVCAVTDADAGVDADADFSAGHQLPEPANHAEGIAIDPNVRVPSQHGEVFIGDGGGRVG